MEPYFRPKTDPLYTLRAVNPIPVPKTVKDLPNPADRRSSGQVMAWGLVCNVLPIWFCR